LTDRQGAVTVAGVGVEPLSETVTSARALVLEQPRYLVEHRLALPDIGDDDGLLRVEACGLCGTDHEQYTGELFGGFPFVPGHESVGVIEAVGDRAAERWGVQPGERVALAVFQSCRACGPCQRGDFRACRAHGLTDMYGFRPIDTTPGLWGGYAQYQYLAPDSTVMAVPQGLDPVVATLFNPLGAGIRWGVTVPGTSPGDVVVVLGPGIRGLSVTLAAKRAGAGFVLVTGRGARDQQRLAVAKRLGADAVVDVEHDDPVQTLRSSAGRLADVVVDVTARAPSALGQAVALARRGGTVVLAGTRGSTDTPGFAPDMVVFKELRLLGALGVDVGDYRAALDLLASPDAAPLIDVPRRVVGLGDAEELITTMAGEGDAPPVHGVIEPWR